MLSLGAGARRVYLAVGATDLRKGFDGSTDWFAAGWRRIHERAAFRFLQRGTGKGALFRREWSAGFVRSGWPGRFDWPEEIEGVAKVAISATEFAALMDGLELTRTRAKLWWRKKWNKPPEIDC